jgi:hypothetical protein
MDLSRHAAVLWRFRAVALGGLALSVLVAFLAAYQPTWDGGPVLKPRGAETWQATSSILVTQPGFPEGRVTLPGAEINGVVSGSSEPPKDGVEFADPARLAGLADLYSKFLTGDKVLKQLPKDSRPSEIEASPFLSSQGSVVLPVIELKVDGPSEEGARKLNEQVFASLQQVLTERQTANGIEQGKRVEIRFLDTPNAELTSGRKPAAAALAFLVCLLGTLAVVHLLAAVRDRRLEEEELASLVQWDDEEPDDELQTPYLAGDRGGAVRLHR